MSEVTVNQTRYEDLVDKETRYDILKGAIVNNLRLGSMTGDVFFDDERTVLKIFDYLEPDLFKVVKEKLIAERDAKEGASK